MVFKDMVVLSHPIGSRYVCNPPVPDTDRDTLILVKCLPEAEQKLLEEGWDICGNGEYILGIFRAYRKGEDNYIITDNELFFNRYLIAAEVSKALNILDKETRIKIHEACVNASAGLIGLIDWDKSEIFWQTH